MKYETCKSRGESCKSRGESYKSRGESYLRYHHTPCTPTPQTSRADEELIDFMGRVLSTRLTHIALKRGQSTRHKVLQVRGLTPQQVYDRVLHANQSGMGFSAAIPPSGTERGGWRGNLL